MLHRKHDGRLRWELAPGLAWGAEGGGGREGVGPCCLGFCSRLDEHLSKVVQPCAENPQARYREKKRNPSFEKKQHISFHDGPFSL